MRYIVLFFIGWLLMAGTVMANDNSSAKYKWLPTESAPVRYPVRLLQSTLTLADGTTHEAPIRRNANNGWGMRGSTRIVGPEYKALPVRLDTLWFSYTEDTFYKGSFALPVEVMRELFEAGVPSHLANGKREEFERIIIGTAPGGIVSIWLDAAGEVVKVAEFAAQKADMPWTSLTENTELSREEYIGKFLAEMLNPRNISNAERLRQPVEFRADYQKEFVWNPRMIGSGTFLGLQIKTLNGESAFIWPEGEAVRRSSRGVPHSIAVYWKSAEGTILNTEFSLNADEMFAAFQKITTGDASHPFKIAIQVTADKGGLWVEDDTQKISLTKYNMELYKPNPLWLRQKSAE